jgi:hypothetical protein
MKKYTLTKDTLVINCNSLTGNWNRLFPEQKVASGTRTTTMVPMFQRAGFTVTENKIKAGNKYSAQIAELVKLELSKMTLAGQELTIKTDTGKRKSIKGPLHKNQAKLIKVATSVNAMGKRLIPYLHGPAGSGKTEAASKLADALDLNFYAQSFHPFSEPGDIFGYVDAMGEVVETPFKKAYTEGGVYLADEMDSASGRVLTAFNMALSQNKLLFPAGKNDSPKMLNKHEDFIFIAAGNTTLTGGNRTYSGRQELDGATIQRLTFIEWNYDTKFEQSMSVDKKWLDICWRVRKNIATHALDKYVISVRNIVDGDALIAAGFTYQEAIEMRIAQGASQEIKSLLLDGIQL